MALEPEFWERLTEIAEARALKLSALVREVDAGRDPARPLASVLRVLALRG